MTRDQGKEILDRVLTWPADRQEDVARMVELMEEQDGSELRLADQQAAEGRRRLADPREDNIAAEKVLPAFAPLNERYLRSASTH